MVFLFACYLKNQGYDKIMTYNIESLKEDKNSKVKSVKESLQNQTKHLLNDLDQGLLFLHNNQIIHQNIVT